MAAAGLLRAVAALAFRRLLCAPPGAARGCAAVLGPARRFGASARARRSSEDKVTVHFINRDGDKLTAEGKIGDSLLDVVVDSNLDIDGFGACEGTLACSTCHLIFEDQIFKKLDAITDEEMDMLDLAYGLTETTQNHPEAVFYGYRFHPLPQHPLQTKGEKAICRTCLLRSRLGCQICLKKFMNNMTVRVPEAVADVRQSIDMSKNS